MHNVESMFYTRVAKQLTDDLSNLLRRGRHAKIHLVLATQDPTIKSTQVDMCNLTARMAFACAKPQDSVNILGRGGAEKLQGKGTMLFKTSANPEPAYLQGAFMSDEDISNILAIICENHNDTQHEFAVIEPELSQISLDEIGVLDSRVTAESQELGKP